MEEDPERAVTLLQQACDVGNMRGCWFLGLLYRYGRGVEENYERAAALLQLVCDGGEMQACEAINPTLYAAAKDALDKIRGAGASAGRAQSSQVAGGGQQPPPQ